MKIFGQIIRTAVNIVTLPVTLPVAVIKDALDYSQANEADNTSSLIEKIKDEAQED